MGGYFSPASWKRVTHSDSYRFAANCPVGAAAGYHRLTAAIRPNREAAARAAPPFRPSASSFVRTVAPVIGVSFQPCIKKWKNIEILLTLKDVEDLY
jgi:hypothetical protein